MTSYTFGGPELLRKPVQTCTGTKEDTAIYLVLETTVRMAVRVPEVFARPGGNTSPDVFEERLREACAEALIGVEANGFRAELVCVQQFVDG